MPCSGQGEFVLSKNFRRNNGLGPILDLAIQRENKLAVVQLAATMLHYRSARTTGLCTMTFSE